MAKTARRAPSIGAILAGAVCVGGGCSTKPPTFAVSDIAIADSAADATTLRVTLTGTNTNKDPLPLYEIKYSMSVDGNTVATARRSPEATIPAHSTQDFVFPVVIPTADVDASRLAVADYRVFGSVTYELPGTLAQLFFDNDIRRPAQGFSESGSFAPEGSGAAESPSAN